MKAIFANLVKKLFEFRIAYKHIEAVEQLMQKEWPKEYEKCPCFYRHKGALIAEKSWSLIIFPIQKSIKSQVYIYYYESYLNTEN